MYDCNGFTSSSSGRLWKTPLSGARRQVKKFKGFLFCPQNRASLTLFLCPVSSQHASIKIHVWDRSFPPVALLFWIWQSVLSEWLRTIGRMDLIAVHKYLVRCCSISKQVWRDNTDSIRRTTKYHVPYRFVSKMWDQDRNRAVQRPLCSFFWNIRYNTVGGHSCFYGNTHCQFIIWHSIY